MRRDSGTVFARIGLHGAVFRASGGVAAAAGSRIGRWMRKIAFLRGGAVRDDDGSADPGIVAFYGIRVEPDADQLLAAYLSKVCGVSCVLPLERLRELTGMWLPPATPKLATWWTDSEGWCASPAASACEAAGWRLESVQASAQLVALHADGRGG